MTVKELLEKLKEYPEDTQVFIEHYNDYNWLTYLEDVWLDMKDELKYDIDSSWRMYRGWWKGKWILKNVLIVC